MSNKRVHRKLDHEYDMFYMEMMATSRNNLYDKSSEIEFKKRMYSYIKSWILQHEDMDEQALMTVDNLLDACCRYSDDHVEHSEKINVDVYLSGLLGY